MSREGARAVHRCRVEWSDTDASGHYHNAAVVRFVEAAEAALVRERGITGYFGAAPRVRYEVDFAAPLWFGQEVTTTLTVERIGTSSMTYGFEVWGEETDGRPRQLAASGRYTVVHVPPRDQRASTPWPADWITALTATPTHVAGNATSPRQP
ncbi:acyl-CoA thioesterase [Streptomyces griseorubiginosus]|uniref:acyl-CoA thioesterase n=1 Tax=Streptomyces griseorubiginosus TaxID=67304 RepID=UPI001AD643B3|nr:thioesterase family protein [Streptomyces griseorubiginosus]MBO4257788.1 acyl-CoA thioesterase [Streptomyces griseorubiginosus]